MWTCSSCTRTFKHNNQYHYCCDRQVDAFLAGKSEVAIEVFNAFLAKLWELGPIQLHTTKSMIVISADVRFAYIIKIGRDFVDVVLPFKESFHDNLCFRKIAPVPGSNDFNHHLRLMLPEDLNTEVVRYLKRAYANGKAI